MIALLSRALTLAAGALVAACLAAIVDRAWRRR